MDLEKKTMAMKSTMKHTTREIQVLRILRKGNPVNADHCLAGLPLPSNLGWRKQTNTMQKESHYSMQ
jgi:hypothetical protein